MPGMAAATHCRTTSAGRKEELALPTQHFDVHKLLVATQISQHQYTWANLEAFTFPTDHWAKALAFTWSDQQRKLRSW